MAEVEEKAKEKLSPARFILEPSGTLTIQIELNELQQATARGYLVMMDEVVRDIYFQRAKHQQELANKIVVPNGVLGSVKNFLKKSH